MRRYLFTVAGLICSTAVFAAQAQLAQPDGAASTQQGVNSNYSISPSSLGNGGVGAYVLGTMGYGVGAGTKSKAGFMLGVIGGYNMTPSLGMQFGVTRLPARASINNNKDGSTYVWKAVATLTRPLQPRLQMIGNAGFAMVGSNVNVNGTDSKHYKFAAALGAGVQYQFNSLVNLVLQGVATVGGTSAANTYGVETGVAYHFSN